MRGEVEVQDYFQRVASEWDNLRQGYFPDAVRDAVVAALRPEPEMRIADVGCGSGFLAAGLAPWVAHVYCIDASEAMLAQAMKNLGAYEHVSYHLATGETLPLEDASVDAVVSNMVLHHMVDPAAALREWARIVRPGGRLVLSDMDEHGEAWMRAEMADLWPGFQRDAVAAWLRGAGLEAVEVRDSGET